MGHEAPNKDAPSHAALVRMFEATFEQAAVGLAHVAPDGSFLRVNRKLCEIVGYTHDEFVTLTFQEITHPDDLESDLGLVGQMLADEIQTYTMEKRYFHKSGPVVWIELTVALVRDETGAPDFFISVIENISERKALELEVLTHRDHLEQLVAQRTSELENANIELAMLNEEFQNANEELVSANEELAVTNEELAVSNEELAVTNEELEVANQLIRETAEELRRATRAKSDFLASMSHELRTPLNSIIGFSGVLLQGMAGPLAEEQEHQLRMVNDAGKHLLALVCDILDIAKVEAGKIRVIAEELDLTLLAREVAENLSIAAARKGLALEVHEPEMRVRLVSDVARLRQILINLMENAVAYTDEGRIDVHVSRDGNWSVVSVTDTGLGVDPDDLKRIFEPFEQVKEGTPGGAHGTGLGLAVSRRLAEVLGGRLDVVSEPGSGSTFTLTVPDHVEP